MEDCSKVPVVSLDYCSHGARNRISEAEMDQRGDSSVLVMPDGMTKSNFAHLILAKGVDFASCEKVVKVMVQDLDNLGVICRCDNEPPILALLTAVKWAWTGYVVRETSAEGDPQFNSAAESSVNVVKGHVRSIKLAVDLCSQHAPSVCGGSRRQDSV